MKDYQEALDTLECNAIQWASNHKYNEKHNFYIDSEMCDEMLNHSKLLQQLIDEKVEQESRKDKLIVGSEWVCVAECLSERVAKGVSYTRLENIKDIVEITKIGLSYVNYKLPKIEMLLEFTMPTQQFLLCFRPLNEGSK